MCREVAVAGFDFVEDLPEGGEVGGLEHADAEVAEVGQSFEHGCHVAAHVEQAPHFVNPFNGEQDLLLEDVDLLADAGVGQEFAGGEVVFDLPEYPRSPDGRPANHDGIDTGFVGALPTALMKSLSGSAANGLMIDTMEQYGADSFVGRLSCVARGASDTTFYILAVYFGSVGITRTRNAVKCGLIADLSGILAAIFISYLFFY